MSLKFERVAVVGATGPTGREIATQWAQRGQAVRVVSRRLDALEKLFPGDAWEKRAGDARDIDSLSAAIADCDLVVDCIGLPADQMSEHAAVARVLSEAVARTGARCLQVSSYWSYIPIDKLPVSESCPRKDGPPWARFRREAEDVIQKAGGAVVQLPDFFGPHVHTSTLQLALMDAVAGRPMNWIGGKDVERDYIYVPDAMRLTIEVATQPAAYGERWLIPGSGPVSAAAIADMISRILGRSVKVRAAGPLLLRVLSLFRADLRALMQMVPTYVRPIHYDGRKLEGLIGHHERTPYEKALERTIGLMG